jgi:hypothetical protein
MQQRNADIQGNCERKVYLKLHNQASDQTKLQSPPPLIMESHPEALMP